MILDKAMLAVRHAVSKEDTRFQLQGIRIERDRVIATDGHLLAMVKASDFKDEDYPLVGGTAAPFGEPFTVPVATCDAVAKAIPKSKGYGSIPILATAKLNPGTNGDAVFTTTDLDNTQRFEARKMEGGFPDYARLEPKGNPVATFTFNADLFGTLAKIAKAVAMENGNRTNVVTVSIFGPDKAFLVTAGSRFAGLLMPCQTGNQVPAWGPGSGTAAAAAAPVAFSGIGEATPAPIEEPADEPADPGEDPEAQGEPLEPAGDPCFYCAGDHADAECPNKPDEPEPEPEGEPEPLEAAELPSQEETREVVQLLRDGPAEAAELEAEAAPFPEADEPAWDEVADSPTRFPVKPEQTDELHEDECERDARLRRENREHAREAERIAFDMSYQGSREYQADLAD